MNKASEPILDLLADTDIALPPSAIILNLNREMEDAPARSTIYRAFDPLCEHGLMRQLDVEGTYYVITELGRKYLDGELSDVEMQRLREQADD